MNFVWLFLPISIAVVLHGVIVGLYRASVLEKVALEMNLSWSSDAVHWNENRHFEMFRQGIFG
jgi:hypothetical protein